MSAIGRSIRVLANEIPASFTFSPIRTRLKLGASETFRPTALCDAEHSISLWMNHTRYMLGISCHMSLPSIVCHCKLTRTSGRKGKRERFKSVKKKTDFFRSLVCIFGISQIFWSLSPFILAFFAFICFRLRRPFFAYSHLGANSLF